MILCAIAAARIFLLSAAFPFFGNVDEQLHLDLIVKYAQGHVPQTIEKFSQESIDLIIGYGSPEYRCPADSQEACRKEKTQLTAYVERARNVEDTQPPVYYAVASVWSNLGYYMGLKGGHLLYWTRFLNIPIYVLFLWISFRLLVRFFPDNLFLQTGVPVLLAIFPQDVFYTLNSDVLSPLLSTAGFFCLLGLYQSGRKSGLFFHLLSGLCVSLSFLNKFSNIAILVLFGFIMTVRVKQIVKQRALADQGAFYQDLSKIAVALAAAGLPILFWILRNYFVLDDITGSAEKIRELGWTVKPLRDFFYHPLFSSWLGFVKFWHDLMALYWRGELVWHSVRIASRFLDFFYSLSSLLFVAFFMLRFVTSRTKRDAVAQSFPYAMSLLVFSLSVLFLIIMSLSFNFNDSPYPSRDYPYMVSGRLITGTLLPFLIVYLTGFEFLLAKLNLISIREVLVLVIALSVMISEFLLSYNVFTSPYNWFHLI